VFSTRAPVVSSILVERAMGSASSAVRVIAQNGFVTSAARCCTDFPFAVTNPISACEQGVSTMTKPVFSADVYQASSCVSATIGFISGALTSSVGGLSSEPMRTLCRSTRESGKPGV
jgi:hypothetical protein